jgi:hypothetical protein
LEWIYGGTDSKRAAYLAPSLPTFSCPPQLLSVAEYMETQVVL